MDAELKEMFGMILGKLDSLEASFGEKLDLAETSFLGKLNLVETSFRGKLDLVETSFRGKLDLVETSLGGKISKLELMFESMQSDIKTIVEVQRSHYEDINRKLENISYNVDNDIGLHSTVLKDISSDVKSLEKEVSTLKRKIG